MHLPTNSLHTTCSQLVTDNFYFPEATHLMSSFISISCTGLMSRVNVDRSIFLLESTDLHEPSPQWAHNVVTALNLGCIRAAKSVNHNTTNIQPYVANAIKLSTSTSTFNVFPTLYLSCDIRKPLYNQYSCQCHHNVDIGQHNIQPRFIQNLTNMALLHAALADSTSD